MVASSVVDVGRGSDWCDEDPDGASRPHRLPGHACDPALLQALERVRDATERLQGCGSWALSDGEVRDALSAATALVTRLESVRLGLVRELDSRPDAVPGARPERVAATFLIHALRSAPGQAYRDVEAARELSPDAGRLPMMGRELASGEVSRAHVDVAVRALRRIPAQALARVGGDGCTGAARVDSFLTEQSRRFSPAGTQRLARHLLAVVDPDATDRFDPLAFQRRSLSCAVDSTGMLIGSFQLDPAVGAIVRAALDHFAAPHPAGAAEREPDGEQVLVRDDRSRAQRYADALHTVCGIALRHTGSAAPVPATVLVVADVDQLRSELLDDRAGAGQADCLQTGPLPPGALRRLSCDGVLHRVLLSPSGAVLDLGRAVRTASAAQRRALAARDRGCVIPGCTAPPAGCEAHHVHPWQSGGRTALGNLALLCGQHHSAVHTGAWTIDMRAGVPWVVPPSWIDPARRPLRNLAATAARTARRVGQQLRIDLDPG